MRWGLWLLGLVMLLLMGRVALAVEGAPYLGLGHIDSADSVAFAPEGRTVLTGGRDGTARLWDAATGKEIRCFQGHDKPVTSVAFAPDGRTILTGSEDNTARLWDAASGMEILSFQGHREAVTSVRFAPNGRTILTGSRDSTARLWDATNGKELQSFQGHSALVTAVAFTPDGRTILTGSRDRTARLWDVTNGEELWSSQGHSADVNAVAVAPDGRTILTGGEDGTAHLLDVATGKEVLNFQGHSSAIKAVAFAPDGRTVLTGSADNSARLWDAATGKEIHRFQGDDAWFTSVAFSPGGRTILTGEVFKPASLWDIATEKKISSLEVNDRHPNYVEFSRDGRILLTRSDSYVNIWDIKSFTTSRKIKFSDNSLYSATISPDSRSVVTAINSDSAPKSTAEWRDIQTWKDVRKINVTPEYRNCPQCGVSSIAISPDGLLMLTGSSDGVGRIWNVLDGRKIRSFGAHGDHVTSAAFSPDGKSALTGSPDETACLWNVATGKEIRCFAGHASWVTSVAFAPNGRTILTGSYDKTARLWDGATGKEIRQFQGHDDGVTSVAFSPDGNMVLTGSADRTARLWDASTGTEIRRFMGHDHHVTSVAFAPDGRTILTGSDDNTARLWNATTGRELIRLITLDNGWIAQTPEGYFNASDGADALFGMVDGMSVRPLTPTDVARWKRPDLVKAALRGDTPLPSTASVPAPAAAPLVLPPIPAASPPQVTLLSPADGATFSTANVYLHFRVRSDTPVTGVRVLVDGQPPDDARGTPRVEAGGDDYSRLLTLPPHDVTLTVIAGNATGDGPPASLHLRWVASKEQSLPRLYVLAAGVSDYADAKWNLSYADDDARELATTLARQGGGGGLYESVAIINIPPNPTKRDILIRLARLQKEVGDRDVAVILLSGHGMLNRFGKFLFLPHDMEPDVLEATTVGQHDIDNALDQIAGSVLLFVDACRTRSAGGKFGPNLAPWLDLLAKTGRRIVAFNSAVDGEVSLERREWGHGAFTKALLEALKGEKHPLIKGGTPVSADRNGDGILSLTELDGWLTDRVKLLTDGDQHPMTRKGNIPDIAIAIPGR